MKRAIQFLEKINEKDDVIIIFNNDGDGICSSVLLEKMLHARTGKRSYSIAQPMPPDKNLIRKIQSTVPTKIIFTDMAIDQQPSAVKRFAAICDILIIDHHQVNQNMNSRRIVHYNPRLVSPKIYQSSTYAAYKICSEITGMKEHLWIAAVGMVSDYNLDYSQDIVEHVRKKFGIEGRLYDSWIGRIADMIEAARAAKAFTCEQMMEIIFTAKGQEDILNNQKFINAYKDIRNEIDATIQDVETSGERVGNVLFYNIRSKYSISSAISTRLSEKYGNTLILIYQKAGNKIKVSARNQKGMNVGKILGKAVEGFGSGGGHEAAAGATMDAKDWDTFRENVIRLAKK